MNGYGNAKTITALFKKDFSRTDQLHITKTNLYELYDKLTILSSSNLKKVYNTINELICDENYNNIIYLQLKNCDLFELPTLPEELYELDCSNNNLYTLPNLPYNLRKLNCNNNNLYKFLDHWPSNLNYIKCNNNNLFKINSLPNKLKTLSCTNNNITFLPKIPDTLIGIDTGDSDMYMKNPYTKKMLLIFSNMKLYGYNDEYGYDSYDDCDTDMDHRDTYVNWVKAYELYQKRYVRIIENWYMECKYNPIYKKCRERIKTEFYDMYYN